MAKFNTPATKSGLLALRRQLAFAEEGRELLEEKRQVLVFELMARLNRARDIEHHVSTALAEAFAALQAASLDIGSVALTHAAAAVRMDHHVEIAHRHLMGLSLPRVTTVIEPAGVQFGLGETSANTDLAMLRFVALLPLLAELAELQGAVRRLVRELHRTQRRCNALSKVFIPACRETLTSIAAALEERERESFVILKMIRNRLGRGEEAPCAM